MTTPLSAVVLCAGKGTRMKSDRAKVLHPLLGRPLAAYPIEAAFEAGATPVVAVIGHQAESVRANLGAEFAGRALRFALQGEQRGTGDAVAAARAALDGSEAPVLIVYGDVPLVTAETLGRLVAAFEASGGELALATCTPADATGYGRIVRDGAGRIQRIVEHRDATPEERAIREINAGLYVTAADFLWEALARLEPRNAQGELYLTDIVARAAARGPIGFIEASAEELSGVNDPAELAERGARLRERVNRRHMLSGVMMIDPATAFIDALVEIGPGTTIGPGVSISGECEIGAGVTVGQGSVLLHSTVGDGSAIKPYSVLEEAVVGPGCHVGPFARLRPGTVLDEGAHVGNFVETKKARLRAGAKANHLAYLGDADVGARANVGAGTITCNYDGVHKHQTVIGDDVFIGSDTQLVAPVSVGAGALVGAGSTITEDVPAGALALSRAPQTVKPGWAERRRKVLQGQQGK